MRNGLIGACLALLAVVGAVPGAEARDRVAAVDARLGGDSTRTRLIVDLTDRVAPRHFVLDDPYRVVIDLPQVAFRFPDKRGEEGRGLVSAFRYGLIAAGRSRIVLDATGPVAVDALFVIEPANGQPARLVLDLVPTTREAFLEAKSLRGSIAPEQTARRVAPSAAGDDRRVVVLDPGHGGVDPGAIGRDNATEKSIVLAMAETLRDKLTATGRYRILMTRDDDSFVSLGDRVRMARDAQAGLFVSIHADTLSAAQGVRGATVYTLSDRASDAEAAKLAEKENRADAIAGVELPEELDDVAGILIDLMQRETRSFSARFASTLAGSLKGTVQLNKNPLRAAGFRVLRAPDVPSALVELGYLSSAQDVKLLMSQEWRDDAADAMVKAIDAFFGVQVAEGVTGSVN